jgi:alkylated DNA repair protein alkB family protein 1
MSKAGETPDEFRKAELLFRRPRVDPKTSKRKAQKKTESSFDEFLAAFHEAHPILDTRTLDPLSPHTLAKHAKSIPRSSLKLCQQDSKEDQSVSLFEVTTHPGLFVIPNAIPLDIQAAWARKAINEFPLSAYSNLTNLGASPVDLWSDCDESTGFSSFKKLRWVNLGYSYDWTNRKYRLADEAHSLSSIPSIIADSLGSFAVESGSCASFRSDTAIINYYYLDSTMGPHVDDAELDLSKPVVSLSLGASAIFLIGGNTKNGVNPTAIALHSGDVIVMGQESRRCYHGVPRIFPLAEDHGLRREFSSEEDAKMLSFLGETRINMNVRQIFNDDLSDKPT